MESAFPKSDKLWIQVRNQPLQKKIRVKLLTNHLS